MGAAASFEGGLSSLGRGHPRYFCHACSRAFPLGSNEEHICPHCGSTFLEEIGSVHQHNHFGQLTIEQARRIANATAMLRLLETQLREELDMLQLAFEQANARAQTISQDKPKVLTKIMKSRLRNVELDLDMLCCQPSCPICSEDFSVGLKVLRLPCTHWFHGSCVLAWLELNQTCPICRSEISDSLPTKDELGELSLEDLDERLKDLNIEIADLRSKEKSEIVDLYIQKLQAHQTAALQPTNQSNGTEPVPINIIGVSHHLPFISFAVRSRNSVPSSSSSSSSGNDGNFDIPFRDNPTQAFNGESSPNDDA